MTSLRTYTDFEDLFELCVPEDWHADSSGQMGTRVIFLSPLADAGFQPNVNVVVNHIPPLTREEFLLLNRLQLKMLSGVAKLPIDQAADQQPAAHVFEWINNRASIPLRVRQQLVFSKKKAFILSATAPARTFDTHAGTFETIFRSFRLKDPT